MTVRIGEFLKKTGMPIKEATIFTDRRDTKTG